MVEGARLESVYRGNSIQGSNPCLSAILETIPAVIGRAVPEGFALGSHTRSGLGARPG